MAQRAGASESFPPDDLRALRSTGVGQDGLPIRFAFRFCVPAKSTIKQIAFILGLSCALGISFNRLNPLGIKSPAGGGAETGGNDGGAAPRKGETSSERHSFQNLSAASAASSAFAGQIGNAGQSTAHFSVPIVNWKEVKLLLHNTQVVLVDAQSKHTFDSNHLRGAVSLPASSSEQQLQTFAATYGFRTPLVLYDGSSNFNALTSLTEQLVSRGFRSVRVMTNPLASLVDPPPVAAQHRPPIPESSVPQVSSVLPQPISWTNAKPLIASGRALLVDARPKPSYDAGHIPGAVSLPIESNEEAYAAFTRTHGTNASLVIYCSGQSCSRSKALADRLIQQYGYRSVQYMSGGYVEWQQSELATPKPGI